MSPGNVNRIFLALFAAGLITLAAVDITRAHYGGAFFAGLGGLWLASTVLMRRGGWHHHGGHGCGPRPAASAGPSASE